MHTWVALFRGINVGGNNVLPMAELKTGLESLALANVRTYIQSGNVVFSSKVSSPSTLTRKITQLIEQRHGFRPHVLLLPIAALLKAIESNPFQHATDEPKSLHFFFLAKPASSADLTAINDAKATSENFKLTKEVFYLHAPDGIGRSKLAAKVEKYLGVVTTARNYRTVEKIHAMAIEIEANKE